MKSNSLISIIIPVYNTEKYLKECLESVINQTYKNLEIIIIDDGSTDNSGLICDNYAKKDNRIKVIHQQNKGLSSSRNIGLSAATGEYIAFIDSDDWLALNCYETVLKLAKKTKADITNYDIFEVYNNTIKVSSHLPIIENETIISSENYKMLFSLWPLVWAKLYKHSFIKNNNLLFPDGLIYEDNAFVIAAYSKNAVVAFCNKNLHYYRMIRPGKLTNKGNRKTIQIFDIMNVIRSELTKNGEYNNAFPHLINWAINNILWLYTLTPWNYKFLFFKKMKTEFELYKNYIEENKLPIPSNYKLYNNILTKNFFSYHLIIKINLIKKLFFIQKINKCIRIKFFGITLIKYKSCQKKDYVLNKFYVLKIPTFKSLYFNNKKIVKFYLFNIIEFYKFKKSENEKKWKIFNIPILKIKHKKNKFKYYILGILCLKRKAKY